jgi:transcription factor SPN1
MQFLSTLCSTDADNDSSDDDGPGLFDDSDDDDDEEQQKPKALSKRERMEALQAKKRSSEQPSGNKNSNTGGKLTAEDATGYDSGDSYNSAKFERTKEDNDFIDTTGDDADAIHELYAEQHFHDTRGEAEEEGKKKKGRKRRGGDYSADEEDEKDKVPDNPIMAAVHRMKKKKKTIKKLSELEEEAKDFLSKMELAAEEDELAVKERRPATKKLAMLPEVLDMLARRDMMRLLLDFDVLSVCRRWVQPLPGGALGNVTVRQRMIDAIGSMTGEQGITPNDLKRSDFGKVVMALYMHPSETPAMKRKLKELIEQWSRPIFSKSGNMKDLEHAQASRQMRDLGMSAAATASSQPTMSRGKNEQDLQNIIATGSAGGSKDGLNRVRVPFSKGFNFSVRPQNKSGGVAAAAATRGAGPPPAGGDTRGNLSKRMLEKGRAASKNQRSANISIEGRPTK